MFELVYPATSRLRPDPPVRPFRRNFVVNRVCRYWRETALMFLSLWSTIIVDFNAPNYLSLALERSSSVPLDVHYFPSVDPSLSLDPMLTQCSRLKELHICCRKIGIPVTMWDLCQSPAPILEVLTISFQPSRDNIDSALPELFSGQTPRLMHLTIRYFSTWPRNQFENLTRVHEQPAERRQTLPQFLDFLRHSPLLEELALIAAGPDMPDGNRHLSIVPVELGRLRRIEIGNWSSAAAMVQFLAYLIIPQESVRSIWHHWDDIDSLALCQTRRPSASVRDILTVCIYQKKTLGRLSHRRVGDCHLSTKCRRIFAIISLRPPR